MSAGCLATHSMPGGSGCVMFSVQVLRMVSSHLGTGTRRAPLLRLIGPLKEPIGMKPLAEALQMASQASMDLLLINPEQAPPVARIIQWSK